MDVATTGDLMRDYVVVADVGRVPAGALAIVDVPL